jgi:hypothetical protein
LPSIPLQPPEVIFRFIKANALQGKGIGWVDTAILCSVQEAEVSLATFDRTLRSLAEDIGASCIPKG